MPWKVKANPNGGYDIVRADTGVVVGHSDTKQKALASVRARYAATEGESTGRKTTPKKRRRQ